MMSHQLIAVKTRNFLVTCTILFTITEKIWTIEHLTVCLNLTKIFAFAGLKIVILNIINYIKNH